jgi:hypothetical protein
LQLSFALRHNKTSSAFGELKFVANPQANSTVNVRLKP